MQVVFPTSIKAEFSNASGHFTVDQRPVVPIKNKGGKYWPEMQTLSMQHFVDISDGKQKIALVNNCLTEDELKDGDNTTLYFSLFRCGSNMIVTAWESVGIFPKQLGSQLLQKLNYKYAIYPHSGDWAEGQAFSEAEKTKHIASTFPDFTTSNRIFTP